MTKWVSVPRFADLYEISDDGQVVRIATHGAKPKAVRRPRRPHKKPEGYWAVDLQRDQVRHRFYVHRLMWEAFCGPIPNGLEINHKNGDRGDNRLENLELLTRSDNMRHCFRELSPSLNRTRGTEHHKAKLTPETVLNIVALSRSGKGNTDIAEIYGVSKNAIRLIMIGKNWRHVTGITPA